MTDNEIIKALEECSCVGSCVDLINRQRAKIEALEMDNAQLQSDIVNANMNSDHALAEIERLKKSVEFWKTFFI